MIGIFSLFEVLWNLKRILWMSFYDSGEYKLIWMFDVTFYALHVYFIYIYHSFFFPLYVQLYCYR
jgi:hypothetical protein